MRSYSLSVNTKDTIWMYLQHNMDKPDQNRIADAFETIHVTVHNIHKKIKEEMLFGVSITCNILGLAPMISTEMKEAVVYLVGTVPIIYQDEIAEFLYDIYAIRVVQS